MSSGFGNFMKNGWHPEKEGTTLKGQVNGLLGRNKEKDRSDHVARPLSSLQDPSTFAPPPKRVPGQPLPPPPRSNATSPGVPPPPYDASNGYGQHEPEEEIPPPQPFRVNTTGLSTAHLPPPPGRKDGADGKTRVPDQGAARPPPPRLPPRLPPRTPSAPSTITSPSPAPPPTSSGGGYLNQGAVNRLEAAGVLVPSLGIGTSAPEHPARYSAGSPAPPPRTGAFSPPSSGQMSELQNRFSKLGKSPGQSSSPPPAEGTTMEQKQAALRAASNFHKDPSSVSMKDARSAASTFNNFRQRHGDQVAAGVKTANYLNQKYDIGDKVGMYASQAGGQTGEQEKTGSSNARSKPWSQPPDLVNTAGKKKPPPPPPPKKKPQLGRASQPPPPSGPDDDDEPPPIPLSTKPTF